MIGLGRGNIVGLAGFRQLHSRVGFGTKHDAEMNIVVGVRATGSKAGSLGRLPDEY